MIKSILYSLTLTALVSCDAEATSGSVKAGGLELSNESVSLITEYETGGKAYYVKKLQKPCWPGGASGVTIGFGYDLGYYTKAQIAKDWHMLPTRDIQKLQSVAGIKGSKAKFAVSKCTGVVVPWDVAEDVYVTSTIPTYAAMTRKAFPKIENTHPHIQGSMTSIVFNRGASKTGSSRSEMRNIATHIEKQKKVSLRCIPSEIRSMKRLWVKTNLTGLLKRREAEAVLVEKAL